MSLDTNLSRSPYFDDFNQKASYYRILIKPRLAIQAREVNQIQSTLQDQIDKFGRSIYKDGSIVEGCSFSFDPSRAYVKIGDNYANGTAFTIADFTDQFVLSDDGLKAKIVNTVAGLESQAPNTNVLYVKYLNSSSYANGVAKKAFSSGEELLLKNSANVTLGTLTVASNTGNANVGNPTGFGYAMSITEGVVFKKGMFLYVPAQTILVEPFSSTPDGLSVGFDAEESIVTAAANSALYDNAAGYPNYGAPGADRLKVVPNLVVRETTDVANTASFFSVSDFVEGYPVTARSTPEYSTLGAEMARRTYETNGDFVITPFSLSTEDKDSDNDENYDTHVNLVVSRGTGYAKGYRVEYLNNNIVSLRKATNYTTAKNQVVSANFGYYVIANEFAGEFGNSGEIVQVELHSANKTAVSSGALLGVSYSSSTKIGTAYVRGFSFDEGTPGSAEASYSVYLFGVTMDAGFNFSSVRSIIYRDGTNKGVADVVLTVNSRGSDVAAIQQSSLGSMIFSFGHSALKTDGFNNTEFTYRKKSSTQFAANGSATVTLSAASGTGTETFAYIGTLSSAQKETLYVVPTDAGITANLTGNVAITASANLVTGTGTAFLSEYRVGDYISVNGDEGLVVSIANNTSLRCAYNFTTTNSNSTHAKSFPIGAPIPLSNRGGRTVICTDTTASFSLGETIATPFNVDVFYDIRRASTVPVRKVVQRNVVVKIDCATHDNGKTGPWSLGIPDVLRIRKIYVSTSGYATSGTNRSSYFTLDNGQEDAFYGLASLSLKSSAPANLIRSTSKLTVVLDCFTHDYSEGRGFFTANSYPIDDVNGSANTNAIVTAQIPLYRSPSGSVYDLRDSVDFRPVASNTAVVTTTLASATVNPTSTNTLNVYPYLPSPDSTFETDLQFYLRRRDRIVMTTSGTVKILEGKPTITRPLAPSEKQNTMTLGYANVPPYPSLSAEAAKIYKRFDYAIETEMEQNRRYTMADVGVLDSRIGTLEYYTSLSLLEKSTADLQVRSSTTGQNRFQNGFFVEPFKGFDLADVTDPQFFVAIDPNRTEMRPAISRPATKLEFDKARSTGVTKHGDLILLKHTSNNVLISQSYATKKRNCVEGNVYTWRGKITLSPSVYTAIDTTTAPTVVNNLDLASNWLELDKAWQTSWGDWQTKSTKETGKTSNTKVTGVKYNADGSIDTTYQTTTTHYTTSTQQRTGYDLNAGEVTTTNMNLGKFVSNISIMPYLKPVNIKFKAVGLKPNTRVYAYFGDTAVSDYCQPTDSNYASNSDVDWTTPLETDEKGTIYGIFYMPANTFKSEEIVFKLCDVDDLTTGANAIQTVASATFYGSKLSMTKRSSTIKVRDVDMEIDESTEQQKINGSYTTSNTYIVHTPPIIFNCACNNDCGEGHGGDDCACSDCPSSE